MKKSAHIFAMILVLFFVGITESFPFTLQETVAAERCDDFRETEEFRISASTSVKLSKVVHVALREVSFPTIINISQAISVPVSSLSESLHIRLRVLRN